MWHTYMQYLALDGRNTYLHLMLTEIAPKHGIDFLGVFAYYATVKQ